MVIETSNMLFDETRDDCFALFNYAQGRTYAFVQAVDVPTGFHKRYWGVYDDRSPEQSIRMILERGGKWPSLPEDVKPDAQVLRLEKALAEHGRDLDRERSRLLVLRLMIEDMADALEGSDQEHRDAALAKAKRLLERDQ